MVTIGQLKNGARQRKTFRSSTPAFQGCPQKRGTIIRLDIVKPKKPNSAKRKTAKVHLNNGRTVIAYIPGIGHQILNLADVLVRGGRVPDLPGVRYHLYRHKLDFTSPEYFIRTARRSKFNTKLIRRTRGISKGENTDEMNEITTSSEASEESTNNGENIE